MSTRVTANGVKIKEVSLKNRLKLVAGGEGDAGRCMRPLGIYKTPNTNTLIRPLKNA